MSGYANRHFNRETMHVLFFSLERYGQEPETNHQSVCPVCDDGILGMERDVETCNLLDIDRCVLCGQKFIYDDIAKVREERP